MKTGKDITEILKNVDVLLEKGYLFYNWEEEKFENDFMCEEHINESIIKDFELVKETAKENNALVATVICTVPLVIEEGLHYADRYGYIVYKGAKLEEDYYI